MNIWSRTPAVMGWSTSVVLAALLTTAMAGVDPPATVTIDYLAELYEPVDFDHEKHLAMYSCGSCHHHTTGDAAQSESCLKCHSSSGQVGDVACSGCHKIGFPASGYIGAEAENDIYHIDKPGLKGALHLQCRGCHSSEGAPVGCDDCHAFTAAGRTRFAGRE